MNIAQMREYERQAAVLEEAKVMKQLRELKCVDEMYYVGELVDLDNSGWVDKERAIEVIKYVSSQN